MNSTKSLIFDLTKILLPKRLILIYRLTVKVMHCEGYALPDTFYRIEIELLVFKLCPVLFRWSFSKLSSGCSSEGKRESPQVIYPCMDDIQSTHLNR